MRPFNFEKATTTASAVKLKTNKKQFIAGGTNLVDLLKKEIATPEGLIDINNSLSKEVKVTAQKISIGAMVNNAALGTNPSILQHYPLIAKAVLAGASPQIRNMASTSGNLLQRTRCPYFYDTTTPCNKRKPNSGCAALHGEQRTNAIVGYSKECIAVHPSDLCIALAALDATVEAKSVKQEKILIPFKDFHKLPELTPWLDNNLPENAIITNIDIATNPFAKNCAYIKLRDRTSYAFAIVSVAAALHLDGDKIIAARLASGGVAHKPWRWLAAEQFLKGKTANAENFKKAADMAISSVTPFANHTFKVPLLHGAITTALSNCLKA